MIAVIQRVAEAEVTVADRSIGRIGRGLVALVSVVRTDVESDVRWMAAKLAGLRVFPSPGGAYDHDVRQVEGGILLVSNFTVAADVSGGRRPSFIAAMPPGEARPVFDQLVEAVRAAGVTVATGEFGAEMHVRLVNEGPLTLIADSRRP